MRVIFLILAVAGYLLVGHEASAQTQAYLEPGAPPSVNSRGPAPLVLRPNTTRQMPVDTARVSATATVTGDVPYNDPDAPLPMLPRTSANPGKNLPVATKMPMPPIPKVAVPQGAEAQWAQCNGKPSDAVLASCSAVIDAGREPANRMAQAYKNRAQAWHDKMQFNAAVADYDQAIRLSANDIDALRGRCISHAAIGQLTQALADCDQALKLKPTDTAALANRGFVYRKMRAFNRSVADYDAVLTIDPKSAAALFGRGVTKLDEGKLADGTADITQAKALQPDVADGFHRYGIYR